MRRLAPIALLFSACTWISDEKYSNDLGNVDDDGDGVTVNNGDCNDNNASISPNVEETWYDGVDADCLGDNDFDADKDGFVPAEHEGKMTTSFVTIEPLPGGDCNDNDDASYPGATDSPYDGVDSDCGGEDDYDQDEDGYVPTAYANLPTANLVDQELLPSGDCNDADKNIHPGQVDTWYDGVDSDCGGENDYDRDNDGFAFFSIPETTDVNGIERGDCNDQNDQIFPDPAEPTSDYVHPTEQWYDGIDSDCENDDDYDADKDGQVPTAYEGMVTADVNGSGNLPSGDCDDNDPLRYLGALERLNDTTSDYDCDQCIGSICDNSIGAESFRIDRSEWFFLENNSNPQNLRYAINQDTLFLSSRADVVTTIHPTNNSSITYHSASYAATFDLNNLITDPTDFFRWRGRTDGPDPNPYGDRQAVVATDEYFIGVIGQFIGNPAQSNGYRRLRLSSKALSQTYYFHLSSRTNVYYPPIEDVSVMVDSSDVIHAVGCDSDPAYGLLQYVRMPISNLIQNQSIVLELEKEFTDMPMERCQIREENGLGVLTSFADGAVQEYTFPLTGDAASLELTSIDSTSSNHNFPDCCTDYPDLLDYMLTDTTEDGIDLVSDISGVYAIVDGQQHLVYDSTATSSALVQAVYGYTATNGDLIIGFSDDNRDGYILIGDPDTLATTPMSVYQVTTDFNIDEVAPYPYEDADGDKLFVTVLGLGDLGTSTPSIGFGIVLR